jgi:hypothetical protein
MQNLTNPDFQKTLSDIAIQKLNLVPAWVSSNYPQYINTFYKAMEGGQTTLVINIGDKILLKLFIPKFEYKIGSWKTARLIQNYVDLQDLGLDLASFGILNFDKYDSIFEATLLVLQFYSQTRPLVDIYYTLESAEKLSQ